MAHKATVIFHINQQAPSIEIGGLSSNEYAVLLPIVSLAHRSAHTVCEPGIKSLVCRGVFSQHNSPACCYMSSPSLGDSTHGDNKPKVKWQRHSINAQAMGFIKIDNGINTRITWKDDANERVKSPADRHSSRAVPLPVSHRGRSLASLKVVNWLGAPCPSICQSEMWKWEVKVFYVTTFKCLQLWKGYDCLWVLRVYGGHSFKMIKINSNLWDCER